MSVTAAGTAAGGGGDVGRWSRHCGWRRWRCRSLEPALRPAEVAMSVAGAGTAAGGGGDVGRWSRHRGHRRFISRSPFSVVVVRYLGRSWRLLLI